MVGSNPVTAMVNNFCVETLIIKSPLLRICELWPETLTYKSLKALDGNFNAYGLVILAPELIPDYKETFESTIGVPRLEKPKCFDQV